MTTAVQPASGRSFRLNQQVFSERTYGFEIEFRPHGSYIVRMPIYSGSYLQWSWPKPTDPRTLIALSLDPTMKDENEFMALDCPNIERAIRLAALYCRYIQNVPESIFWRLQDGKIYFHIGLKIKSSTKLLPDDIKQAVRGLIDDLAKEHEAPLLAEDVIKLYQENFKQPYRASNVIPKRGTVQTTKPVLYLEIDNVLIFEPEKDRYRQDWRDAFPEGEPVPGAKEFLLWAAQHFDCRWLSDRALLGELLEFEAKKMARVLGLDLSFLKHRIRNPNGAFPANHTKGINFSLADWAWITNDMSPRDKTVIIDNSAGKRVYDCDARKNPGDLIRVWHELKNDFRLT